MSDVIIALARIGYRPPVEVFDTFVKHIADHAHELQLDQTLALSEALTCIVPGYIGGNVRGGGDDGHQQYHDLQMRLRATEMPARVMLRAIPSTSGDGSSSHKTSGHEDGNHSHNANGNENAISGSDRVDPGGSQPLDAPTVSRDGGSASRPGHHRQETGGGGSSSGGNNSSRNSSRANVLV